jgi:peptidoglycan hydrolase-like protein with peptidoglycan-binding domain
MVEAMQNKWANSFELPTPGLETIGLLSAYASVFYRFENDLYGGKIPITADEKNLDKPVGLIKRFDSNGQERNYMQLGDSGGDVKLLQQSLQKLNLYDGEINGEYDEELAKIIAGIQTNAQPTNAEIKVDGKADVLTLAYLAKQINSRGEVQGYIQQMQAALANR